jgi:hypothetical protein
MEITEEQREMIRRSRERAVEIRKRKLQELEEAAANGVAKAMEQEEPESKWSKVSGGKAEAENVELEEFEVGASEYVTKTEAMKMYCLPEGTMAVCKFVEKENPRRKGWTPMKLYYRSEIRERSRKRYGGTEGLMKERKERAEKRYHKDLERTKDVFK